MIVTEVDRLHGRIWNGKTKDAQITLERIRDVMPVFQGEGCREKDPAWHRLWKALREINRYLSSQSTWLVNYAERHRAGLRIGTALTEATANFLVNRRMPKSQQMRWSRRGADLLLQVRGAAPSMANWAPASANSSKPSPAPKRLWLPDPHSIRRSLFNQGNGMVDNSTPQAKTLSLRCSETLRSHNVLQFKHHLSGIDCFATSQVRESPRRGGIPLVVGSLLEMAVST